MRSTRIAAVALVLAAACSDDGDEAGDTTSTPGVVASVVATTAPTSPTVPATTTVVLTEPPGPAIDDTEAVGGSRLYTVDVTTGAATSRGRIGGGRRSACSGWPSRRTTVRRPCTG